MEASLNPKGSVAEDNSILDLVWGVLEWEAEDKTGCDCLLGGGFGGSMVALSIRAESDILIPCEGSGVEKTEGGVDIVEVSLVDCCCGSELEEDSFEDFIGVTELPDVDNFGVC